MSQGVLALGNYRDPILRILFLAGDGRVARGNRASLRRVGWAVRNSNTEQLTPIQTILYNWVEDHEIVRTWILSDAFLRAPALWPSGVQIDPSPYEMASLHWKPAPELGQALIQCYSHGLSIELIEHLLQLPLDQILELFEEGMKGYRREATFILWEMNLDWAKVRLPAEMAEGLLERLDLKNKLMLSPLDVGNAKASILTCSPRFMAYALKVAPRLNGFRLRSLGHRTKYSVKAPREFDG